jgi:hypothetical protein
MSMVDGFSGYNQGPVLPEDKEKTTFTTPWGTFMYAKIPFRLMNARETFQRDMDIEFIGEKDNFVVIYLDDIAMYSESNKEHCDYLRKVFLKCRKFGLSLMFALFSSLCEQKVSAYMPSWALLVMTAVW